VPIILLRGQVFCDRWRVVVPTAEQSSPVPWEFETIGWILTNDFGKIEKMTEFVLNFVAEYLRFVSLLWFCQFFAIFLPFSCKRSFLQSQVSSQRRTTANRQTEQREERKTKGLRSFSSVRLVDDEWPLSWHGVDLSSIWRYYVSFLSLLRVETRFDLQSIMQKPKFRLDQLDSIDCDQSSRS
jgi:hypothetical protein